LFKLKHFESCLDIAPPTILPPVSVSPHLGLFRGQANTSSSDQLNRQPARRQGRR
jgi:hypothetical protein